jgi:hypothetical protein
LARSKTRGAPAEAVAPLFLPLLIFACAKISCGGGKPIHAKQENQTAKPENQRLQNQKPNCAKSRKQKLLKLLGAGAI